MSYSPMPRAAVVALASLSISIVACVGDPGAGESTEPAESSSSAIAGTAPTGDAGAPHCDGLLPEICEICTDGIRACAHWVVEDGQCRVQICPPHRPVDCEGTLPELCVRCPDGIDACVHWAFVDGECKAELCPPTAIPPETPAGNL